MARLYPQGVDLAAWCARYEIEVFEGACPGCGRRLVANRPFIDAGGVRGMTSEECRCGEKGHVSCIETYVSDELQRLIGATDA